MAGEAGTSSLAAPGGPLPPIATSQSSPALHTHGRRRRAPRTEPLIVPGTWAGTTPVPFRESEREIEGRSLRGRGKEERKRTAERGARGTRDGTGRTARPAGAPGEGPPVERRWPGGQGAEPRGGPGAASEPVPAGPHPADTGTRDSGRRGRGGRGGPLALGHSHLVLVDRLHQLAPGVEVGASPEAGAPALQQTPGHLRHGRPPPRPREAGL